MHLVPGCVSRVWLDADFDGTAMHYAAEAEGQIAQGMVVIGSFVGEQEEDLYVWIRRFESEEQREELYEKVYQSETWKNELSPLVGDMMDRTKIVVTRLEATPKSVIQ